MCSHCHTSPHLPGCPNEPDPPVVSKCENCRADIRRGDEYYEDDGGFWVCAVCNETLDYATSGPFYAEEGD